MIERLFSLRCQRASLESCDLIAAGSLLEQACSVSRKEPPLVWGAGFLRDGPTLQSSSIAPVALRGRLSAARCVLGENAVVGDPGLLSARLLDHRPAVEFELGIVPHYVDQDLPAAALVAPEIRRWRIIDVTLPAMDVLRQIAECEVVLSSSLHGLVVADALRIPNQWIKWSDRVLGAGYKFHDYYSSFSPEPVEPVVLTGRRDEIDRKLLRRVLDRPAWPGLDAIEKHLLQSFPWR